GRAVRFISAPELNVFVVMLCLRTVHSAVLHDVPGDCNRRPDQRYGAQHINAIQKQHSGQHTNRSAGCVDPVAWTRLRGPVVWTPLCGPALLVLPDLWPKSARECRVN